MGITVRADGVRQSTKQFCRQCEIDGRHMVVSVVSVLFCEDFSSASLRLSGARKRFCYAQ